MRQISPHVRADGTAGKLNVPDKSFDAPTLGCASKGCCSGPCSGAWRQRLHGDHRYTCLKSVRIPRNSRFRRVRRAMCGLGKGLWVGFEPWKARRTLVEWRWSGMHSPGVNWRCRSLPCWAAHIVSCACQESDPLAALIRQVGSDLFRPVPVHALGHEGGPKGSRRHCGPVTMYLVMVFNWAVERSSRAKADLCPA